MKKYTHIPALLVICLLCFSPLLAQEGEPTAKKEPTLPDGKAIKLTEKPWVDPTYGIAMKLPINSELRHDYQDGVTALLKTKSETPIGIKISIRTPDTARAMETVIVGMRMAVLERKPTVYQMKKTDRTWKIKDSVASTLHFGDDLTSKTKGLDLFSMRGAIQINPKIYVTIEASTVWPNAGVAARTVENMMNSLDLSRLEKQAKDRAKAIDNMNKFMAQLTPEKAIKSLVESQYFKLERKNAKSGQWDPAGFMHLVQRDSTQDKIQGEFLLPHGVRVYMSSYAKVGKRFTMNRGIFYQSLEDRNHAGKWSLDTRDLIVDAEGQPRIVNASANAIRTNRTLRVKNSTSTETKQFILPNKDERTYVSQALAWVLPQLLPKNKNAIYGYYWYDQSLGTIVYREEEVTAIFGQAIVTTKLGYGTKKLVSKYNAKGNLIERVIKIQQPLRMTHRLEDYPDIEMRMSPEDKETVTAFVRKQQAEIKPYLDMIKARENNRKQPSPNNTGSN